MGHAGSVSYSTSIYKLYSMKKILLAFAFILLSAPSVSQASGLSGHFDASVGGVNLTNFGVGSNGCGGISGSAFFPNKPDISPTAYIVCFVPDSPGSPDGVITVQGLYESNFQGFHYNTFYLSTYDSVASFMGTLSPFLLVVFGGMVLLLSFSYVFRLIKRSLANPPADIQRARSVAGHTDAILRRLDSGKPWTH